MTSHVAQLNFSQMIVYVDLDGTLANVAHRIEHIRKDPPDWDKWNELMHLDTPHNQIRAIVLSLYEHGAQIILPTGRFEMYRDKTERWLQRHRIPYHSLRMRPDGDYRSDVDIKREMIKPQERGRMAFAIEDRSKVVAMWREEGIMCLQCADDVPKFLNLAADRGDY